jgi:hypothetical protein
LNREVQVEFNYRPPRTLHLFLPTHPTLPIQCLTTEVALVITALFLRNVSIQLYGHVVASCCYSITVLDNFTYLNL